jgi:hypothetical protein
MSLSLLTQMLLNVSGQIVTNRGLNKKLKKNVITEQKTVTIAVLYLPIHAPGSWP